MVLAKAKANLAKIVNYDCKIGSKLKHTSMIALNNHVKFVLGRVFLNQ